MMMVTYSVGQKLYMAYVDSDLGAYCVEFKIKSVHVGYLKITAEWNIHEPLFSKKRTPGTIQEYTQPITEIVSSFGLTPIEALEKLRVSKQGKRDEKVEQVVKFESDIRAIIRAIDEGSGNPIGEDTA